MRTLVTIAGREFVPDLPSRLMEIAAEIRKAGGRAFLVGGWVRDALLGKDCRDYDVEVYDLTQDELVPILKRYGKTNLVGKAFGVIHLAMRGLSLDFSFPRTESKVGYGHRGFVVHTDEKLSFREAALRRDFTINAMGMELPELTLCDPYGGIEDLKTGVLRHVGPAFVEDSLRVLRGVQFASRFGLTLAPETVALCRTLSLADLSIERLYEEFKKWLMKPGRPSLGLRAFVDVGLEEFFPEVNALASSWDLLGQMLDEVSRRRLQSPSVLSEERATELLFAALLAGNAVGGTDEKRLKPLATGFLSRITNEVHLVRRVPEILACLCGLDLETVPPASALRRLSVRLDGLEQLCLLVESIPGALLVNPHYAEELRKAASTLGLLAAAPQPFLTGKSLIALGVAPGKVMGEIIRQSFERQLDGELADADAALLWAKAQVAAACKKM